MKHKGKKMNQFPLYDSLKQYITKKDLTVKEKTEFIEMVDKLDDEGYGLMYALIKCYQLENEKDTYVPYKANVQKDQIEFNLAELPNSLKRMLYKFLSLHLEKLQQDCLK